MHQSPDSHEPRPQHMHMTVVRTHGLFIVRMYMKKIDSDHLSHLEIKSIRVKTDVFPII